MDLSGFGMLMVACAYTIVMPISIAGILFVPIAVIQKRVKNTGKWNKYELGALFLILYLISIVGSCAFIYFFYLRYMYVM